MFRIGKAINKDLITIYSSECSEEHYDDNVRQIIESGENVIAYINQKYNCYISKYKRFKRANGFYHYYFE